jgi:leucyl aminopeptidase
VVVPLIISKYWEIIMEIKISKALPWGFKGDMVIYCVRQDSKKAPLCVENKAQGNIDLAFAAGDFSGKDGEHLLFYPGTELGCGAKRVMVAGLGRDELKGESFRALGGLIAGTVKGIKGAGASIMVVVPEELNFVPVRMSQCLTEGLILGNYRFNKYKSPAKEDDEFCCIDSLTLAAKRIVKFVRVCLWECGQRRRPARPGTWPMNRAISGLLNILPNTAVNWPRPA